MPLKKSASKPNSEPKVPTSEVVDSTDSVILTSEWGPLDLFEPEEWEELKSLCKLVKGLPEAHFTNLVDSAKKSEGLSEVCAVETARLRFDAATDPFGVVVDWIGALYLKNRSFYKTIVAYIEAGGRRATTELAVAPRRLGRPRKHDTDADAKAAMLWRANKSVYNDYDSFVSEPPEGLVLPNHIKSGRDLEMAIDRNNKRPTSRG